jgi:hypothetical protein
MIVQFKLLVVLGKVLNAGYHPPVHFLLALALIIHWLKVYITTVIIKPLRV